MSLSIASLNSGSNGNCYYLGNQNDAILVDAGISLRETEKRMKRLGLLMEQIKAIFISHEHIDHITGLPAISKKYQIPVYLSEKTYLNSRLPIEEHLLHHFSADQEINIGNIQITCFSKKHDAADPFSFLVSSAQVRVSVITDIGIACKQVIKYFKQSHAAFLEANYDEMMLEKGHYPYHLKNRIRGGLGHISNEQALELFLAHRTPNLQQVILSHLSKNNNDPAIVANLFAPHAGNTEIIVASRYQESALYTISSNTSVEKQTTIKRPTQLSLFNYG